MTLYICVNMVPFLLNSYMAPMIVRAALSEEVIS